MYSDPSQVNVAEKTEVVIKQKGIAINFFFITLPSLIITGLSSHFYFKTFNYNRTLKIIPMKKCLHTHYLRRSTHIQP